MRRYLLTLFLVLAALVPARAVVDPPLSMRKLATISHAVVLCEELELRDHVIDYENGPDRTVMARCRVLKGFQGDLAPDDEFIAHYDRERRWPMRAGFTEKDASGRIIRNEPPKYFPPGRALLFLEAQIGPGIFHVIGARLIQGDEIFDPHLDGSGMGMRLDPMAFPENVPPGDCLRYGEAELVADFLRGLELSADPTQPEQYLVPEQEDPLTRTPMERHLIPLAAALAPILVALVLLRLCRRLLPRSKERHTVVIWSALLASVVVGGQASTVFTIRAMKPLRWEQARLGMTREDVRCIARSAERWRVDESREVIFAHHGSGPLRGWSMDIDYDNEGRATRITTVYRGPFHGWVPARWLE